MPQYAYIFVERNMGHDYAYAEPPLGMIRGWLWRRYIYPEARRTLEVQVQKLNDACCEDLEKFKTRLATGISVYSYSHRHTVYSVRIAPDTLCPDPRATGRCPYFVMHLLMPGIPEVISKRFGEFRAHCQDIAWHTMFSGRQGTLKVLIPDDLYLQNKG